MTTSSAFGKAVKKKLVDLDKSQAWLIDQVKEKTGLFCDSSLMSRLLNGSYKSQNMTQAVCEILGMKVKGNG